MPQPVAGPSREDVRGPFAPGIAGPPADAPVRLLERMPKAEVHLHLDGSLRVDTALDLARTRGVDAPTTWNGMSAALVGAPQSPDQADLLRAFDLPIALLQDADALERVTMDLVEAKAADNVRYAEIRWGPLLHTARGLSLKDGIGAVVAGGGGAAAATPPPPPPSPWRPPGPAPSGSRSMPASGVARPRSGARWPSTRSGSPTGPARPTIR